MKLKGYLPRYLVSPNLFLSYYVQVFDFSVLAFGHILWLPGLSTFSSGVVLAALGQLSTVGGRCPAAGGRLPGGWRSPTNGVCCSRIRGWGLIWPPPKSHDPAKSICICGPTSAQKVRVGCHSHSLKSNSPWVQDYSLRSPGSQAWGGMSGQGVPPFPFLSLRRQQYHLEWNLCKLTWVILSKFIAARLSGAQRDLWLPRLIYAPMFTRPIWAQNYHVPPASTPSLTLIPSDDMASGYIPLGLQTQCKSVLCLYVITKIDSLRLRHQSLQEKSLC